MSHENRNAVELFQLCASAKDREAWVEFHRRYHRTIAGVVVKTLAIAGFGKTDDAEDLIQDVYARLCRNQGKALRDFVPCGQNSEFAYLKVISRNVVFNQRSRERDLSLEEAGGEAVSAQSNIDRKILVDQIDEEVRKIASERDRQLFWLYYRAGLTAAQISSFPTIGLNAKGVESALGRLTRAMKEKFGGKPEGKGRAVGFS